MAQHTIPFGIFTNHKAYQFVRMGAASVRVVRFNEERLQYNWLDEDAPEVYAHLFETVGVPRNIQKRPSVQPPAERTALLTEQLK
jgi:hypothetical protein